LDTPASATYTGPCTGTLPPPLTSRHGFAGPAAACDGLGILRRADGTRQVTYFGHQVYMFLADLVACAVVEGV